MRVCQRVLAATAVTATTSASAVTPPPPSRSVHADVVVVGGGVAGCLLAGRLALDNVNTVLVEAGDDVRQQPSWHWTLPCSQLAHRLAQRDYESTTTTTTPQRTLAEADDGNTTTGSAARVPVYIPTPRVLGGHGVMGSRCWNTGDARDWVGAPWSFADDLLPRLLRFEHCETAAPHRGRQGTFTLCNAPTLSPYYRRVCEAFAPDVIVARELPRSDHRIVTCSGRVDVLVDRNTGTAHSTLQKYVLQALQLKRPLQLLCNHTATHLQLPSSPSQQQQQQSDGARRTHRVTVVAEETRSGAITHIHADTVLICAGCIGSAQLLSRTMQHAHLATSTSSAGDGSNSSATHDARVTDTFWDVPQVVLQYTTRDRDSYNSLTDPLVRALLRGTLRLTGRSPSCLHSSWDDLVVYVNTSMQAHDARASSSSSSSSSSAAAALLREQPDVQIVFQPFTMNNDGTQPLQSSGQHGCQFVIRPLRPRSRGRVDAAHIDPNYFAIADDAAALRRGVALVKRLVATRSVLQGFVGDLVAERLESSGQCGGSCSGLVDAQTLAVRDMRGVYVCGSAVLPQPLSGSTLPYTMVLADKLADALLRKQSQQQHHHRSDTSTEAATPTQRQHGSDDVQAARILY